MIRKEYKRGERYEQKLQAIRERNRVQKEAENERKRLKLIQDIENKNKSLKNAENIIFEVCKYYNCTREYLTLKTRLQNVVYKRHIAAKIMYDLCGLTNVEIGALLGLKNHATVLNSRTQCQNLIDTDEAFRYDYQTILNFINTKSIA